jgi:hypothetical protein
MDVGIVGERYLRALFIIPEWIINSFLFCVFKQGVYKPVYKHALKWAPKQGFEGFLASFCGSWCPSG